MPQLQRVDELGFADFVAMLLVETLDSIVAAHTSQEERLRALAEAAVQDEADFARESVTDDLVEASLTRLFPDGKGGTTIVVGAEKASEGDLAALGIKPGNNWADGQGLTAAGVAGISEGVRQYLARENLASLREVARRGVPRVRVNGGVLRSKLTFSAVRRAPDGDAGEAARLVDPGGDVAAGLDGLVPGVLGPLPSTKVTSRRYSSVLHRGVMDSIASTRLTVTPAKAGGSGGGSDTPTDQSSATIQGEVEIHFHAEG